MVVELGGRSVMKEWSSSNIFYILIFESTLQIVFTKTLWKYFILDNVSTIFLFHKNDYIG